MIFFAANWQQKSYFSTEGEIKASPTSDVAKFFRIEGKLPINII
jgi:hypothetical protein